MAESILTKSFDFWECLIKIFLGFPSSPVVKNPPANVGDMRSIPRPGRAIYHGAPESVCCDY